MDGKSFFILVTDMRNKQKQYFATRDKAVLAESIELERKVDDEIDRVQKILHNHIR